MMVIIDNTVVNVALPTIQRDLAFNSAGLAWVVDAYLITFGGFLLLGGRMGDLLGRRRVLLGGLVLTFSGASRLAHSNSAAAASLHPFAGINSPRDERYRSATRR